MNNKKERPQLRKEIIFIFEEYVLNSKFINPSWKEIFIYLFIKDFIKYLKINSIRLIKN